MCLFRLVILEVRLCWFNLRIFFIFFHLGPNQKIENLNRQLVSE